MLTSPCLPSPIRITTAPYPAQGHEPKPQRGGRFVSIPPYSPEQCWTKWAGCGAGHNTQVTDTRVPSSSQVYFRQALLVK